MNQSDLPPRFTIPFANAAGAGYIRSIPTTHQAASGSDAPASLTDGFPPETFTPAASGGVPPNGQDVNGLLNWITKTARWAQSGGSAIFDATFVSAIGGYPKGAVLASALSPGIQYTSTVDANTTNPDGTGAANWLVIPAMSGNYALKGHVYIAVLPGVTLLLNWGAKNVAANSADTDVLDAACSTIFGVWHGGGTTSPTEGYKTAAWPGTFPNTGTTVNLLNGTGATLTVHWIALGIA